jgi:ATP-dependent Clp protease ATP-binding subunit ClpA
MFERYTEKARRTIFFARYEASQFGCSCIETEHLVLGLFREDKALANQFLASEAVRHSITQRWLRLRRVNLPPSQVSTIGLLSVKRRWHLDRQVPARCERDDPLRDLRK